MWFFRQTGLRKQELVSGSKLRSAIEEARNLSVFQRSLDPQLLDADPRWMNAVSPQARIRWGKMVCEEFSITLTSGQISLNLISASFW